MSSSPSQVSVFDAYRSSSSIDSDIAILIPLEFGRFPLDIGLERHDPSPSRRGESIFKSPAVPKIRCAFERCCVRGAGYSGSMLMLGEGFRPGTGKENFEVRRMAATCLGRQLTSLADI
jgi:hypothetical protein